MKVGVVILNWNGLELLKSYLPSVVKFTYNHVIYLADNASTDESILWTRQHYPDVKIIAMQENRGYAGGYNQALKSVEEEVVCLLNNDVTVTEHWCDIIARLFETEPDLAACQPLLLDDKNPDKFEYAGAAGGYLDKYAYPYCRGRIFDTLEVDQGQYKTTIDLHWASGAALFLRRNAFDRVGGLDPDYFAHQEEIDLCWRLRLAGHKIGCASDSKVYHLGGGTLNNINPQKTFYNFRNSLFNIVKNDHQPRWWWRLFIRMLLDGIAGIKFLLEARPRHFFAVLKAHFSFYKRLGDFKHKRKKSTALLTHKTLPQPKIFLVYQYFVKGRRHYTSLKKHS
ncbi:glycosyltransferase family 2 protein [Nonlabens xiamenensis]|uniref:glycosyltransferase family 2 protein n=1 Tax=Nonlabens xiamenensis TaxID=2341043 RepID=UPI000F60CDEA|nr:glycosyltransferase family 2 protein [Nonlabens xiamenensis]